MIVAIIVKIGNVPRGYPNILIISISEIVPPPIGTALTKRVATKEINITLNIDILPKSLNKYTKYIYCVYIKEMVSNG